MTMHDESNRPAPLDTAPLEELRAFSEDDGPDLLSELIDIFLDDTPPRLDALLECVKGGDPVGTRENAHALKSSCAQLGALHLSEMCKQLESMGREEQLDGALPLAEEALFEFGFVKEALLKEKRA
ncbi:MAG: hypothetical protein DHS20C15_08560 [Planctomycetota bacterium]|nr:MAG: hypothetical protein DHS20C15_08560 [Planctomycetota bacterium]